MGTVRCPEATTPRGAGISDLHRMPTVGGVARVRTSDDALLIHPRDATSICELPEHCWFHSISFGDRMRVMCGASSRQLSLGLHISIGEQLMKTTKILTASCATVVLALAFGASAASAAGTEITVSPSPTAPGSSVEISGDSCVDGDGNPGEVLVEVDGRLADSVEVAPDGSWTAWLTAPLLPGSYAVVASCDAYYGSPVIYDTTDLEVSNPVIVEPIAELEMTLSKTSVKAGDELTIFVEGFAPNDSVNVRMGLPPEEESEFAPATAAAVEGEFDPITGNQVFGDFNADDEGVLALTVRIPADTEAGRYAIGAFSATAEAIGQFDVTVASTNGGGTIITPNSKTTANTRNDSDGQLAKTGSTDGSIGLLIAGGAAAIVGASLIARRRFSVAK